MSKWRGPYFIRKILNDGYNFVVSTESGKERRTNIHKIRRYNERETDANQNEEDRVRENADIRNQNELEPIDANSHFEDFDIEEDVDEDQDDEKELTEYYSDGERYENDVNSINYEQLEAETFIEELEDRDADSVEIQNQNDVQKERGIDDIQ